MPDETPSIVPQVPGPSPTPSPAPVSARVTAWRTLTANAINETVGGLETPLRAVDLLAFQDGIAQLLADAEI